MATTTEEIAIKLGIKNADLKAALADSSADIRKFKKAGESTGNDGLLGTLKETKKSVKELHHLFAGAGIVRVVKEFFDLAIESAKKNTDATNKNAEAVREFGRSLEDVHHIAGTIAVNVVGFFNRIGGAIGDAINMQDAFARRGIAGVKEYQKQQEIVEATAKAADEAEKRLAESRAKHGAEFISITNKLQDIEKKRREEQLKGIDVYETEFLTLGRLAEIQKRLAEFNGSAIERRRLILELAETQLRAEEANVAVIKDQREQWAKAATERDKYQEQFAKDFDERKKAFDELAMREALSKKEELELFALQSKGLGALTDSERARLALIIEQKKLRVVEVEMEDLIEKKIKDGLTPEETKRLGELQKQFGVLTAQVGEKERIIKATAENQKAAEESVTSEIEEQVRLEQMLNDEKTRAAQLDKSRSGTVTQKGDLRTLNEIQLDQLIANLNKQLTPIKQADASYFGVGQQSGTYKSIEQYLLQQNLDQAITERNLRRQFAQTESFFGDEYAQRQFAPDIYARLAQLFNPDQQKKDSQNLSTVATGLQALMPDKFNGAIR